ncbi:MAG: hypothetical protein RIC55_27550 [Pirellulaceae bacterium]
MKAGSKTVRCYYSTTARCWKMNWMKGRSTNSTVSLRNCCSTMRNCCWNYSKRVRWTTNSNYCCSTMVRYLRTNWTTSCSTNWMKTNSTNCSMKARWMTNSNCYYSATNCCCSMNSNWTTSWKYSDCCWTD